MADERDEQATQVGHQVVDDTTDDVISAGGANLKAPDDSDDVITAGGANQHGEAQTEVFFSRDAAQEQKGASAPPTPPPPSSEPSGGGDSPAAADRIAADQQDSFAQNPLPYVGGAFVGAFVVAQILKRITGGGD